jgi:inner membrane protein
MDNICHTLAGAALARAGLEKRSPLAAATLMIAANFPDIDVVAVPLGRSVDFRRGWTHGVLALVVLPLVLTALVMLWDRWRRRPRGLEPVRPRAILLLAALGMLTHPTLDWMNEYGLRWLMPFDGTWFYGDSLFIVDPWLLLVLGTGVWMTRRRLQSGIDDGPGRRPAMVALALAGLYILGMVAASNHAERVGRSELARNGIPPSSHAKFSASFANPARWRVLVRSADVYRGGTLTLFPSVAMHLDEEVPVNDSLPESLAAAATPEGQRFLGWSRFPFYVVAERNGATHVLIADLRYTPASGPRPGRGWASVEVVLGRPQQR